MPIDVHAHYVPSSTVEALAREGSRYGIALVETAPACHAVRFAYGLTLRPFFAKLTEPPERRRASMDATGIDRQLLSTWCDVFGYGLETAPGTAWHRLLNDTLAAFTDGAAEPDPSLPTVRAEHDRPVHVRYDAGRRLADRHGGARSFPGAAVYDTLLHDARALRYLASRVGVDRLVIGSDDGFPPADHDPLGSLRRAGFSEEDVHAIAEANPRRLFGRLT